MAVKKFYGKTTREALRQVRDALGNDALILSNRQLHNGDTEIVAVADSDFAIMTGDILPASPTPTTPSMLKPSVQQLERTYAIPLEPEEEAPLQVEIQTPAASSSHSVSAMPTLTVDNDVPPILHAEVQAYTAKSTPADVAEVLRTAPMPPPSAETEIISNLTPASTQPQAMPTATPTEKRQEPTLNQWFPEQSWPQNSEPILNDVLAAEDTPKLLAASVAIEDISQEIKLLRSLLEGQLAGLAWNELRRHHPERLVVLSRLLNAGFSPALSRQIVEHMPPGYNSERGMKWARTALQHNLPTVGPGADIIESGGVYALVGPTGVGKTTTVAKLAAHAVLRHGVQRVALITTDSYRIGAQDQLRIYGKILGIPVYAISDSEELQQTLSEINERQLILIDTVGMGQRDQRLIEQISLLGGLDDTIKCLLLLASNIQGSTLDDIIKRYQRHTLTGCIFTKIDEAYSLASGLDAIIRHKLPLYYTTNGQRVPEDLHVASGLYLIDRVFKAPPQIPAFQLKQEEYPLYLGAHHELRLDFSWRDAPSKPSV